MIQSVLSIYEQRELTNDKGKDKLEVINHTCGVPDAFLVILRGKELCLVDGAIHYGVENTYTSYVN